MPKRIPITAAKRLAQEHGLRQVILLAWDGERTHVVTYGKTTADCRQAAEGGNTMKRALGWPEELCDAVPSRAKRAVAATSSDAVLRALITDALQRGITDEWIANAKAALVATETCQ